jgi:hypothetical protein
VRLVGIRIRDYRSVFVDELDQPFDVELSDGMNAFVGRNNCGKSNVLRAVALALDPAVPFDPELDIPGPRQFSHPVITLRFAGVGDDVSRAAQLYEHSVAPRTETYAALSEVRLEVGFPPDAGTGYRREEVLLTPSGARPSAPSQHELLDAALARLREAVRFVLISSGESLESVLEGNFREILHSVIRERLAEHFERAERSRQDYIHGLQEDLLGPLRQRLREIVAALFPEVEEVTLDPAVSAIDATLSHVGISLRDVIDTPLARKGTGVRGGVLVAMLRYLADNATRSIVFALEEPEAFLHPAGQEDLRDNLELLGERPDVMLLVTTHSPFTVPRSELGRVSLLAKDRSGRTRVAQSAPGNAAHAPLIGDLFREVTYEELLARATELPSTAAGVLLVEGEGDEAYLRLAVERAGRPNLLADIHIAPAGGCSKLVAQAVLARAASGSRPVCVLLDNDEPGRQALKLLTGAQFKFQKNTDVLTYAVAFPKDEADFPYEAEDMFPAELLEAFVEEHGSSVIDGSRRRPDGEFHYDLNGSAKAELLEHLQAVVTPQHVGRWLTLIGKIRDAMGLAEPEPPTDLPELQPEQDATATEPAAAPAVVSGDRVLVVADKAAWARYFRTTAGLLDASRPLPPEVSHLAFYVDGEIKPTVPLIRVRYGSLRFSQDNVTRLLETGSESDRRAADLVTDWLGAGEVSEGAVHHLVLLSSPDADTTLRLDAPVRNTKTTAKGKPMAWVVGQRTTSFSALASGPATTDELEDRDRVIGHTPPHVPLRSRQPHLLNVPREGELPLDLEE